MRKLLLTLVAVLGLSVIVGPAVIAGDEDNFAATLSGYREVPAVSTGASGTIHLEIEGNRIRFRLNYRGLEAPVIMAHIHFAQPDVNGGIAVWLCGAGGGKPPCPQEGTVTGVIRAADVVGPSGQGIAPMEFQELVRAIRNGVTYANVHSDMFPNGEIRGNLRPSHDDR